LGWSGFTFPKAYKIITSARGVANIVFVFLPWAGFSALLWLWNIVFNSWLNRGWAEGNFFLLANTAFCTSQTLLSFPLMAEFEFYLRRGFLFRSLSLIWALIYNFAYFLMLADWFYNIYALTDEKIEELGSLDMLMNMFFIYNSILHSGIVLVNAGIIAKETALQFYELAPGRGRRDYALSLALAVESVGDWWFLNPLAVFDKIYFYFSGYHSIDIIEENPENEKDYVLNWGK
jgi:hypothetical protein